ncbi:Rpn family recombination-promoting nuclease/putative transposase [Prochlorothrix hollandica]|uniref:Rpn family recombination-promoting nuclease/putative transposase n=1 Tax=Prochlorothrix hollandica TaxID=1223 RepID=UPI0003498C4D|nr:Rpn family recombination-promoting nuclease/putative transposase [Prochlorothrix hollandica]
MNGIPDRYLNPLTDFGFKKLFGTEPNKALLIDLLNSLLPPHHQIQDLTYSPTEHLGTTEINRKAIFDLYCHSPQGERFIVELQKAKQNFFKDRSVYYASFPVQEQGQKGAWNFKLDPVYTVGILDFVFEEDREDPDAIQVVKLKNQHCKTFYEKLTFIYIELPKFTKSLDQLQTHTDKWLFLLKSLSHLLDQPQNLQESVFSELFTAAEVAQFDPLEQVAYRESLKHYWDLNNVVDTARDEGWEEGWEEGRVKGREEGREAGRAETIAALIRGMEAAGFSQADIDRAIANLDP